MKEEEKIYLAALQHIPGLESSFIRILLSYFVLPSAIWKASKGELEEVEILGKRKLANLIQARSRINPVQIYEALEKKKVSYMTFEEDLYFPLLKSIYDPPIGLFYKGKALEVEKSIAIVGARHATAYGKNVAYDFARQLSEGGVIIVSGGARGIDGEAHRGALKGSGKTIAVLGCGIDVVYPKEHQMLFDSICEDGMVLSEYGLGVAPLAYHFPIRNRIIAGITQGTLVVEAAAKSGSLITADAALSEGRDVFAIPGSIYDCHAEGTHWLLRQGAVIVIKAEDILGEYGWFLEKEGSHLKNTVISFNKEEKLLLQYLSAAIPQSVEGLLQKSQLPLPLLQRSLLSLEMKGIIANIGNQQYILTPGR